MTNQHPSLAVLDTGATQSAGSIEAVANLIDYLPQVDDKFSFRVTHDKLPLFHFGDGGWLRALSQVHLMTSLGEIGVFTVQPEGVPILVGADMCERWGIPVSYA